MTPGQDRERRRSYGQSCPVAHALDLVGDRWALLVVRELRLGPRRFADLHAALPGLGPSVLSQRLRDLASTGVLTRRSLPAPARGEMYELTTWGAELEPVFQALARWGAASPVVPLAGPIGDDAVMLGVRTFLGRAEVPGSPTAEIEVRLTRDAYRLGLTDGRLTGLVRDTAAEASARIDTDPASLQALLVGGRDVAALLDDGSLTVTGDQTLATALLHTLAGLARAR